MPQYTGGDMFTMTLREPVGVVAAILTVLNTQIKAMEERVEEHFGKHPDAKVYLSQPGLGPVPRGGPTVGRVCRPAMSPGSRSR